MIEPENLRGPAGATTYLCPVDGCDWFYVDPPFDVSEFPRIFAAASRELVDALVRAAAIEHAREVELVVREHVERHTPVEFLATITRLQAELATTQPRSMPT